MFPLNISNQIVNATAEGRHYYFYNNGDVGFINNYGVMNIRNLTVEDSVSRNMIYNTGTLTLQGLTYDFPNDSTTFDVNALHSLVFILSQGVFALVVHNAEFIGCHSAIQITGGTVGLSSSQFESQTLPISVDSAENVIITNCEFTKFGELFGSYNGFGSFGSEAALELNDLTNISVIGNVFSGYHPGGFMMWSNVMNAVMSGNVFEIDTEGVLYGADSDVIGFNWQFATVGFVSCVNAEITENEFTVNDLDNTKPWINFRASSGTTCLSGNRLVTSKCVHV